MTDHANGGRVVEPEPQRGNADAPAAAVRVPVTDKRVEVEMVWTVRGPWAELLGPGASITLTHTPADAPKA